MSISGVITTKDILRHGGIIVREFGAAAYFRCCVRDPASQTHHVPRLRRTLGGLMSGDRHSLKPRR